MTMPLATTGGSEAVCACDWFHGAHEGAHELSIDLFRHGVHVDALTGKKFACVLDPIDARGFDTGTLKTRSLQLGLVLVLFERACNATDPQQHVAPQRVRDSPAGHHIRDSKASAGLQYPK